MKADEIPKRPMLSMGMGIDSAAILVRWIHEPATRRFRLPDGTWRAFALEDLVVVTAMTGDEYDRTRYLMERYLLPLMREHGIRYVQIARHAQEAEGRYDVLSDSRATARMVMAGNWRLRDELTAAGTLPQIVPGTRRCSSRAKGDPLDWFAADEFGGEPYWHVVGFAAEETSRRDRDQSYTRNARNPQYPLIEWGWDRQRCDDYLFAGDGRFFNGFGERWQRSCCGYCPFQSISRVNLPDLIGRWRREPDLAALAVRLEWSAVMFNQRMQLFGRKSARTILVANGMRDLVYDVEHELARMEWAVYDVRRAHIPVKADRHQKVMVSPRDVRLVRTGRPSDLNFWLTNQGGAEEGGHRIVRLWKVRNPGPPYPTREHFWVAGPRMAEVKEGPGFATAWRNAVDEELRNPRRPVAVAQQMSLLDLEVA